MMLLPCYMTNDRNSKVLLSNRQKVKNRLLYAKIIVRFLFKWLLHGAFKSDIIFQDGR
ncbi:hypothetical protein GCWU000321_00029 [Dialister invisus DSM 15470]|uniref:Uncharacterized protein n=1 Tax=Dialister invisus DSM 15470 TaxID=592028 RepID=C9LL94_9FIRM|nr:hypothetical protein GCWU000321_00029 [Dialister invisus DSM 15470]